MSGLLVKDMRLLGKRRNYLIVMFLLFFCISFSMDYSFFAAYVPVLTVLIMISTINYDEFDNGMSFLMTLPITPKIYAIEKYVLGVVTGLISMFAAVVVTVIQSLIKRPLIPIEDLIILMCTVICIVLVLLSVLLPVELKFGAEKSRIVIIILAASAMLLAFAGGYVMDAAGIEENMFSQLFVNVPGGVIAIVSVAVAAVIFLLSMSLSVKIMEKKEF